MANKRFTVEQDSGANITGAMGISEHTVVRMMAGEVETLRGRLADALEQMGYRVLDDNPLRARHGARGAASYYMSANALNYPATLEISLKQQGKGATRVTFDYAVVHGHYGRGDRQTLTREAEAIVALAALRATPGGCVVCGADFLSDSRFCRNCGAPAAAAVPAELEVLRLTANVRAGHQWTVIGATILAVATLLTATMFLGINFAAMPKAVWAPLVASMLFSGMGWWAMISGIRKTHLTLNPREATEEAAPLPRRTSFAAPRTNELAPAPERLSITEGETLSLDSDSRSAKEPAPLYQEREWKRE
ncbi:MAG: hypothetical protein ACKV2V_16680 [Blastocatellia bacterium]